MRNPLTIEVESRLGIMFISLLAVFFLKLLFELFAEFDAEVEVQAATVTNIRAISAIQRNLMDIWISSNGIEIPEGVSRYRYVDDKYPDKPWLKKEK